MKNFFREMDKVLIAIPLAILFAGAFFLVLYLVFTFLLDPFFKGRYG